MDFAHRFFGDARNEPLSKLFEHVDRLADAIDATERIRQPLAFKQLFDGQFGSTRLSGRDVHTWRMPSSGLRRLLVLDAVHEGDFDLDAPSLQAIDDLLGTGLRVLPEVITHCLASGPAFHSCHVN
jgi:hypothetical protein